MNHLVIARKNGSSGSRRQRTVASDAVPTLVARWRKAGFNTFWHYGPKDDSGRRPLIAQWID